MFFKVVFVILIDESNKSRFAERVHKNRYFYRLIKAMEMMDLS